MKFPEHLRLFISGSAITIGGNVVLGLLNYLVRRTLALQLTPFDYGLFYGSFSLISTILGFLDLGMTNAGTVLIAEDEKKADGTFSSIWILKVIFGAVAALLFFLLRHVIAAHYLDGQGADMLGLLAVCILFATIDGAYVSYYCGKKLYQAGTFFRCSIAGLLLGLVYFLSTRWGITGVAASFALAYMIFCPIQLWWISRHGRFKFFHGNDPEGWKRLFLMIGVLAIISGMQTLLFNMDSVMLTALRGPEETAVYNIVLPITQLLLAFCVFASVFTPIAVNLVKVGAFHLLKKYVLAGTIITAGLLPAVFFGGVWCGRFVISILFRSDYAEAAMPILPWLLCAYLVSSLAMFLVQILVAMRRTKSLIVTAILTVVCNLVLNFLLIRYDGARGAAIATFLSYLFLTCTSISVFFCKNNSQPSHP